MQIIWRSHFTSWRIARCFIGVNHFSYMHPMAMQTLQINVFNRRGTGHTIMRLYPWEVIISHKPAFSLLFLSLFYLWPFLLLFLWEGWWWGLIKLFQTFELATHFSEIKQHRWCEKLYQYWFYPPTENIVLLPHTPRQDTFQIWYALR